MKKSSTPIFYTLCLAACAMAVEPLETTLLDAPPPPPAYALIPWPNQVPADCPFPQSETLTGIVFTGRHAEYTGADTWYPSWAADGNLYSPWTDGKAYLVAQGASDGNNRRYAYNSWITADQAYLTRVKPAIANMNDAAKYEFFAGNEASGEAKWTNDFSKIKPIAEWRDTMGCVTMTYNAPLKKYLMCVTGGTTTVTRFNTYILESDRITGPWKLVSYLRHFGEQAYFVNFPSKFIAGDGRSLWLCYAGNFSEGCDGIHFKSIPTGSRYGMCLQEVRLLAPTDPVVPQSTLTASDNIAPLATVSVGSTHPDYAVRMIKMEEKN